MGGAVAASITTATCTENSAVCFLCFSTISHYHVLQATPEGGQAPPSHTPHSFSERKISSYEDRLRAFSTPDKA